MNNEQYATIATEALRQYGLETAQLTRLGGEDNVNFRVDADGTRYVLHLHRAARQSHVAVASQLAWLRSLHTDTALVLPQPVANLRGEVVTGIAAVSTELLCTVMTWIKGRIPPTSDALTDGHLAQVGALMAHLHRHTQQFVPPHGFTRPTYDAAYFRTCLAALSTALRTTEVDPRDLRRLETDADHILAQLARMERTPDTFGLIHADFHSGNYVLHLNKVQVIDFDRCGFGFFLFDLALALMELREHQRPGVLAGYEAMLPLPSAHTRFLPIFVSLAYLDNLGFHAADPQELPFIVAELPLVLDAMQQAVAHTP